MSLSQNVEGNSVNKFSSKDLIFNPNSSPSQSKQFSKQDGKAPQKYSLKSKIILNKVKKSSNPLQTTNLKQFSPVEPDSNQLKSLENLSKSEKTSLKFLKVLNLQEDHEKTYVFSLFRESKRILSLKFDKELLGGSLNHFCLLGFSSQSSARKTLSGYKNWHKHKVHWVSQTGAFLSDAHYAQQKINFYRQAGPTFEYSLFERDPIEFIYAMAIDSSCPALVASLQIIECQNLLGSELSETLNNSISGWFHGNFSSAYFWQIQDMSSKPFEFHQPFFIQSREGYFPRMLGIDKKESISFPVQTSKQESEVLWGGKIQKIDQMPDTEEKWTDLLAGMISKKNLLPVYRDFSPLEDLEDQIRYFSETSDRLQGIHTLLDCDFSALFIQAMEILNDFYPKSPNLIFSFNQKFSLEERKSLWNLSDYGNALLVPCTEAKNKPDLSEVAVGLEVMSFHYRSGEDLIFYLDKFLRFSRGNTCEFSLNFKNFSKPGVVFSESVFLRDDSDPLVLPEGFKSSPEYLAKLFQSSNLESFYSEFLCPRGSSEEDLESWNYMLSLKEVYSELDFLD